MAGPTATLVSGAGTAIIDSMSAETSQHSNEVDVTIVLPVYNESGHLEDEISRIHKTMGESDYSYEIVVVDDGSTDGSGQRLANIDGIRLIRFATNRGSGSARKYGTQSASGRIVVWTDVDMTYPNDTIPDLLDSLDGYDQVVGARKTEEGTVRLLRRPAKWLIRRLASYLTGVRIPDLNSGFRAFRRDVADQFLYLLPRGFSCVTTLTMAFLSNGYSVRYVPIDYAPRAGESKFHWWKDTRRYLLQVLRLTLMWEPMRIFGPPAAVLGIAGLAKLVYDLVDKDFRVATNTLVILGVSFALALIGMVADMLVQLNKRPHDVMPATIE
ncbi:MAG TPA: glycosyltransferase family 2 protein [Acidimicrobiia bacterium]|nr:glycosyltransferase family 2 protein [Acidimicrobiia bacterium]